MCVYSMVMDHYLDKWQPGRIVTQPDITNWPPPAQPPPIPTPEEIAEFRRLLERAKEYDRKHNEPDCGLEEKKEIVRKLAEQLGVEITLP